MSLRILSDKNIYATILQEMATYSKLRWVLDLSIFNGKASGSESYSFLGQSGTLQRKTGDTRFSKLVAGKMVVEGLEYDAGLRIPQRDIDNDNSGAVMRGIGGFVERQRSFWVKELSNLIMGGTTTLGYDGVPFFGAGHAFGGNGSWAGNNNLLPLSLAALPVSAPGTLANPTTDALQYIIRYAIQTMFSWVDKDEEPINETARDFVIVVPTRYWSVTMDSLTSAKLDSGKTNPLIGIQAPGEDRGYSFEVVPNVRFNATFDDKIAIFRRDGAEARPFILQEEPHAGQSGPSLKHLGMDSDHWKLNDEHLYRLYTIRGAGYGEPNHAILIDLNA